MNPEDRERKRETGEDLTAGLIVWDIESAEEPEQERRQSSGKRSRQTEADSRQQQERRQRKTEQKSGQEPERQRRQTERVSRKEKERRVQRAREKARGWDWEWDPEHRESEGRRRIPVHLPPLNLETVLRLGFLPFLIFWLELVLHIRMGEHLGHIVIWFLFSLSAGFLLTVPTLLFKRKVNRLILRIISFVLPFVYTVEMIAKTILTSYYPLSFLGTAAGNRLTDYLDVILPTTFRMLPAAVLLFLPSLAHMLVLKNPVLHRRKSINVAVTALVLFLVFHILGLGAVHLPWKGDLTPADLYNTDTDLDEQVEQFGLLSMLRLDVKHMFLKPAVREGGFDFGDGSTSSSASGSASTPEPEEPATQYGDNVMDVNLSSLRNTSGDEDFQWLCDFFNSVEPTKKNQYTGMFKDYNVIFLTLEGFTGYAISQELTPTLWRLTHEGFHFNNFYTALHFTSTSGGECQNLLGIYPKNGAPATLPETGNLGTDLYFSLAQQTKRLGYEVLGYHANSDMYNRSKSHPNLGYDWHQFGMGFDGLELTDSGELEWPQRDSWMIEASVDDFIHSSSPFHVYYLTISGHMPYSDNRIVRNYESTVRNLPYSETTQNYIGTALEVEKCFSTLLEKLQEAGKLDKTLIVACADHIPYFDPQVIEELAGRSFGDSSKLENIKEEGLDFDIYKNSLIIWSSSMAAKGISNVEIDKVCCQVDILPTVSNLLGLEYDSRMLGGTDILSDSEGMVIFSSRCWKTDRGLYNRFTGEFTPAPGVTMTPEEQEEYVSDMKNLAGCRLQMADRILSCDFYHRAFSR